jgi:hypothetical protein
MKLKFKKLIKLGVENIIKDKVIDKTLEKSKP